MKLIKKITASVLVAALALGLALTMSADTYETAGSSANVAVKLTSEAAVIDAYVPVNLVESFGVTPSGTSTYLATASDAYYIVNNSYAPTNYSVSVPSSLTVNDWTLFNTTGSDFAKNSKRGYISYGNSSGLLYSYENACLNPSTSGISVYPGLLNQEVTRIFVELSLYEAD